MESTKVDSQTSEGLIVRKVSVEEILERGDESGGLGDKLRGGLFQVSTISR